MERKKGEERPRDTGGEKERDGTETYGNRERSRNKKTKR